MHMGQVMLFIFTVAGHESRDSCFQILIFPWLRPEPRMADKEQVHAHPFAWESQAGLFSVWQNDGGV